MVASLGGSRPPSACFADLRRVTFRREQQGESTLRLCLAALWNLAGVS